jgi:hypothetical protein
MEPEGSLPHSQEPATFPYPEPYQSSPCSPHPTSWRSILILSSHWPLYLCTEITGYQMLAYEISFQDTVSIKSLSHCFLLRAFIRSVRSHARLHLSVTAFCVILCLVSKSADTRSIRVQDYIFLLAGWKQLYISETENQWTARDRRSVCSAQNKREIKKLRKIDVAWIT